MKMKNLFSGLLMIAFIGIPGVLFSQDFSVGGQFGYSSPQGGSFENEDGESMSKFGLAIDGDVLYHLEQFDNKLAVGLAYNSSILFGASIEESGISDVGLYGLSLYGVKGYYSINSSGFTPYFALSTGLSRFSTPDITMTMNGESETYKGESAFSFGLRPEIGLDLGGFVISAAYFLPMSYSITDDSAGAFQVSIGFRYRSY